MEQTQELKENLGAVDPLRDSSRVLHESIVAARYILTDLRAALGLFAIG